jgi:type IV secretory pathway TraG/TraD family ATPase VirD4
MLYDLINGSGDSASKDDKKSADRKSKEGTAMLLMLTALLIAAYFYKHGDEFYYRNFVAIHLTVLGFLSVISGAGLYWLTKKNRDTLKRFGKLRPYANPDRGVLTGTTTDQVRIFIPDEVRTGHVQIIGATGRGKTESVIFPWVVRDLIRGQSVVLIDGKGDYSLKELVQAYAADIAVETPIRVVTLDLGNPEQSHATNPLRHGSPAEITDRLFRSLVFRDEFYKNVQYRECLNFVELLHETEGEVTLQGIYEVLTNRVHCLERVKASSNERLKSQIMRGLAVSEKDREERMLGLLSQIEPLTKGEIGKVLNSKKTAEPETDGESSDFSLGSLLTEETPPQTVIIVSIPTLKFQESGRALGKILLQEIAWAVGHRSSSSSGSPMVPVYLDEFSAFVYEGFTEILNKARSANVPLHLSHQSLGDLEAISPAFAKSVNTNTNVKVLLGLNDPDNADFFAKHMGTKTTEKVTERASESGGFFTSRKRTGDVSIREVESYHIHPNQLKNYTHGRGVLHFPTENGFFTEEMQFRRLG